MHIGKSKKSVWKLYDSIYMTFWTKQNCKDETEQWLPEVHREKESVEQVRHGQYFRAVKQFCMIL